MSVHLQTAGSDENDFLGIVAGVEAVQSRVQFFLTRIGLQSRPLVPEEVQSPLSPFTTDDFLLDDFLLNVRF